MCWTENPSRLLQLPPELLSILGGFLPLDGILALKLTHPILNHSLPALPRLKDRTLDSCVRFAIERHRASPQEDRHEQIRCILCKKIYPRAMFSSSSSPACLPLAVYPGAARPEVVELPPSFCAWHVSRLARVVRTEPGQRNEWVSDVKRMCMHSGCIEGWHKCDCGCNSCGHRTVRTYTRFLNNKTECKKFKFLRKMDAGPSEDPQDKIAGRLYVREDCWKPGAVPEKYTIEMPVRYQDVDETFQHPTNTGHPRRQTSSVSIIVDNYATAGEFLCTMPS